MGFRSLYQSIYIFYEYTAWKLFSLWTAQQLHLHPSAQMHYKIWACKRESLFSKVCHCSCQSCLIDSYCPKNVELWICEKLAVSHHVMIIKWHIELFKIVQLSFNVCHTACPVGMMSQKYTHLLYSHNMTSWVSVKHTYIHTYIHTFHKSRR
jgi:hypothetical protein